MASSSSIPDSQKRRAVISEKARSAGRRAANKSKMSPEAQQRISDKIKHMIDLGEYPNTPKGRAAAAGKAYGMERGGRLRAGGKYVKK